MKIIGIMGPGESDATPQFLSLAKEVGALAAQKGFVVLTGGMKGVMESAAEGAHLHNGLTIGIGPTREKTDMNEHIDIKIPTGASAARNYTNVLASDVLVFIGLGSPGTLSELAFALQAERPIFILNTPPHTADFLSEYKHPVTYVQTVEELSEHLDTFQE
jgi:uncharacterized protein (TIGR00725 family)